MKKHGKGAIARKAMQVRNARLGKARNIEAKASSTAAPGILVLAQNYTPELQRVASDLIDHRKSKTTLTEADALRWSARKRAKPERYDATKHQAGGSKDDAPGAKIATGVLKIKENLGSPNISTEKTRWQLNVPIKLGQRQCGANEAPGVSSGVV